MRICNISNLEEFFEVVGKCKGRIELVTSEGDRINLKSKLAQYFSLAEIFSGGDTIPEMEILTSDADDLARLIKYLVYEKV